MSDLNNEINSITNPLLQIGAGSPDDLIVASLRRVLAEAGPRQVEVLRSCAVPRWFDVDVLAVLRGRADGNERVLELLRGYSFVRQLDETRYAYQDEVRSALLAEWRKQRPDELREINLRLAQHFDERVKAGLQDPRQLAQSPLPPMNAATTDVWGLWTREALYHRLMAGQQGGMEQLRAAFDSAEAAYRLGAAEALLQIANDVSLDRAGQLMVRYMRARIERAELRLDVAEQQLNALLAEPDLGPLLAAEARLTLGEVLAETGQWARATELYRESLGYFQQTGRRPEAARTMLRLGEAYQGLGLNTGGWHVPAFPQSQLGRALAQVWYWLLALPFYLVAAMLRRTPWTLPRPQYAASYQNWLLIRLYRAAQDWYERAHDEFAALGDDSGLLRVELQRTEILLLFGYVEEALAQFDVLRTRPAGQDVDRMAWIDSYRAAALLQLGDVAGAQAILPGALARFREVGDFRGEAAVLALQARAAADAGAVDEALDSYRGSLARFRSLRYTAAREQVLYALRAWQRRLGPSPTSRRISALLAEEPEKRYVGRFPRSQLSLLQALLLAVFPLAMLLATLVAPTEIVQPAVAGQPVEAQTVYNLWNVLGVLITVGLLTSAAYTFVALTVIFFIPLDALEREQPDYLITDPAGIARYDYRGALALRIGWPDIRRWIRVDRRLLRRPLPLFSYAFLEAPDGDDLRIDGITGWYNGLQGDIGQHLRAAGNPVTSQDLGYTLLLSKSAGLLALAGGLLLLFISTENRWVDWLLRALPPPLYAALAMIAFSGILILIPLAYWLVARPLALIRALDLRSRWPWVVGTVGFGAVVLYLVGGGQALSVAPLNVATLLWGAYILADAIYTILVPKRQMLGRAMVVGALLVAVLLATPRTAAIYYTNLGKTYSKLNDYAAAEQVYLDSLQMVEQPQTQADVWLDIGYTLYQQRRYAESIEAYNRALRLLAQEPDNPEVRQKAAVVLYNRGLARAALGDRGGLQDLQNACTLGAEAGLCQNPSR